MKNNVIRFTAAQLAKQKEKASAARDAASVQPEMAHDYIEVQGVKFFRPTMAHVWVLMKIIQDNPAALKSMMSEDFSGMGTMPQQLAYVFAHSQDDVRNKVLREALSGQIEEKAFLFLIDSGLGLDQVIEAVKLLMDDVSEKKMMEETEKKEG